MKKILKNIFALLLLGGMLSSCGNPASPDDGDPLEPPQTYDTEGNYNLPTDRPINVLFLGNSLIFFNDMPQIFDSLATAAGKNVHVDSVTQGSCTMSLLASETIDIGRQARNKLTTENWDFVIVEPSRRATPFETTVVDAEIEAAIKLDQLAHDAGGKTLIYSVWGNADGSAGVYTQTGETSVQVGNHEITRQAHANFMWDFSKRTSEAIHGSKIIRSGYAFENTITNCPDINLYHTDYHHPSPAGSFLVACNVYNAIFEERCADVNYNYSLGENDAALLRGQSDLTMIDKVVPQLDDIPDGSYDPIDYDQKALFIGAALQFRDDYHPADQYKALMNGLDQKVSYELVLDGSYTNRKVSWVNGEKALMLRTTLINNDFDVIFIQISRRVTKNSPEVEAAEKQALLEMLDLLHEETNNILIYAPKGDSGQSTFGDNDTDAYVKTGTDSASAIEQCHYYSALADQWAEDIGGKSIPYSEAYLRYKKEGMFEAKSAGIEYLHACCFYTALYQEPVPETCSWDNIDEDEEDESKKLSTEEVTYLRNLAYDVCVNHTYYEDDTPVDPPTPPEPTTNTENVLFIGAPTIMRDDYHPGDRYSSIMSELETTVNCKYLVDTSFTYRKIAENGSRHSDLLKLLQDNEFDAIILQISRRVTKQSTYVETAEIEAIKSLKETLQAETDNLFVFAPKGESGQSKFVDNDTETYSKDGKDSTDGKAQCHYYSDLSLTIAEEIGGKAIRYSDAYLSYKYDSGFYHSGDGASELNTIAIEYLNACCLYSAIHQEIVPSTITWTNNVEAEEAASIREIAKNYAVYSNS